MVTYADREVEGLCRQLAETFRWDHRSSRPQVVDRWSSRTSELFRCRWEEAGPPSFVVKVLTRERDPDPEGSFHMLGLLGHVLEGTPVPVARAPRRLGWLPRPPTLAMEYVPGQDGASELRRLASEGVESEVRDIALRCGATLAAWHHRQDVTIVGPDHPGLDGVRATARRLGVRFSDLIGPGSSVRLVPRFRDFGIYNFRRAPSGELFILDPPQPGVDVDVLGRDMGWFLASVSSSLMRPVDSGERLVPLRTSVCLSIQRVVAESASAGYSEVAGVRPAAADFRIAALLEATFLLGRMRRSFARRPRRPSQLLALALAARKRARQV